jgi:hypothetical protein
MRHRQTRSKLVLKLIIVPLIAAGLSHFWGAKSNQKRLSVERLLCALGLCTANQPKPGLQNLAPLSFAQARASASIAMPCNRTWPPLFCLISAEAYLLTEKKIKSQTVNNLKFGIGWFGNHRPGPAITFKESDAAESFFWLLFFDGQRKVTFTGFRKPPFLALQSTNHCG